MRANMGPPTAARKALPQMKPGTAVAVPGEIEQTYDLAKRRRIQIAGTRAASIHQAELGKPLAHPLLPPSLSVVETLL
jgi:hypothetical protein